MRQQYWRRVLTGSTHTVPDDVRERAGVEDAALSEEERDYRLTSTINRSWAVDNLGLPREQVRTGWAQLRGKLARRYHVADDERELFAALSVDAQDAPRRERAQALYEAHCSAALLGRPAPAPAPLPEGEEELPFVAELAEEAQERGAALRRRYLPLAQELAEGLNVFAALEDDAVAAPRVFAAVPEFARAVDALADMDTRSRELVYAIAQEEFRTRHPQQGQEGLYRTMLRASRRSATGLGIGAGQALAHATIATMTSLGSMLGGESGASLKKGAESLDRRARIAEEARRLLQEEVKPLQVSREAGFAGQLMVDAAGAAPAALAACSGGAGFAALGLSGMGEAVAAARLRAPEGSQWLQYLAGVVGGGLQASIYSGMGRVGGQLLSNAIGNFARSAGKGATGYTLSSLGVLGAVGAEEAKLLFAGKAADAAGLATQELAARLEQTASNIDWKEYGDNAQDLELNLREAAMNLPFILIASGRVALRHFRSRDAVLGDGHALQQWGIDEATRDAIMNESNINRQGDMLRDALRSSKRWSAPGFLPEAIRAMRLLNTDYYRGFKEPQAVVDFLKLPSQGSLVPRAPFVQYSAKNAEHAKLLQERHGSGEKVNRSRLALALQLWDEWFQKAHIVPGTARWWWRSGGAEDVMPTEARRRHFGQELMRLGGVVPPRVRPGGFYAPHAEVERMAMLRDRVAEIQDLSYQVLLTSFPLDALSHSTRGLGHLRQAADTARVSLLEAVGRSVLRRATGTPETEALDELGKSVSDYYWRRRYTRFPPGWMSQIRCVYTKRLNEYAMASFSQDMADFPPELRDAYRIALGFRSCAGALYELLPTTPDFRTALARGLSPADAYLHLLSRELGVELGKARGIADMLAPYTARGTDMRAYRLRNERFFDTYSLFTGHALERGRGEGGKEHWRVRRPNGSYTHWHRRRSDAFNDLIANASFIFMPFSYDRLAPLRTLDPENGYDLIREGRARSWQFTGYDQLCRIALRDTARAWMESAPYALPGFEMNTLRRYVYLGGNTPPQTDVITRASTTSPGTMLVDNYTLSSPLRLVQARFRTYWWRQLRSGLLPAAEAGGELVRLGILSPEQWQQIQDIAKPLLMPRSKNVPLKLTPPPDVAGMHRALAEHLTAFSTHYFLAHLDDMPLPPSAREWFKLAPLCPLRPGKLPRRSVRLSMKHQSDLFTCLHNRVAARELQEATPAMEALRRTERAGLLLGSPLVEGLRNAVGLNRAQNTEQAWCMNNSGAEAMMSASPPFWRLMERPVDGWRAMDAAEQEALRAHAEPICRTEPAPEAEEAEARGEQPDYLLAGLQNLQDVLTEYPVLHQFGFGTERGRQLVHQLSMNDPFRPGHPFAEPECSIAPLYTGGRMRRGFALSKAAGLPDSLQGDNRIVPALQLLGALRSYPGSRPYVRREGIQWRGEVYGGIWGRPLPGLSEGEWGYMKPLGGLLDMLERVDELSAELPEGAPLTIMDMELHGLGDEVDLEPLAHVSLYRNWRNPEFLCRLMPGEPECSIAAARVPYVVQSFAGTGTAYGDSMYKPEEMHLTYTPLERFRPYDKTNLRLEETMENANLQTMGYLLDEVLALGDPEGHSLHSGMAGLRELLMRFVEDSGLSRSFWGAEPDNISSSQLRLLQLSRELLMCVCGANPAAARERIRRLAEGIRADEDERNLLLHTLYSSAHTLYRQGELRLKPKPSRSGTKQLSVKFRTGSQQSVKEGKALLQEWTRRNRLNGHYAADEEGDPLPKLESEWLPHGGYFYDE